MISLRFYALAMALIVPFMPVGHTNEATIGNKVYYDGKYAADHWALQPFSLNDPKVVALAYFHNAEYVIFMNPTDERGYRSLVMLINNQDMSSTFNRDYTSRERIGLGLLIQLLAEAYSRIVPIPQTALMGNNCHHFDNNTGVTHLGTAEEPCILHAHVMGRGNPEFAYVDGVKLNGPVPGVAFLFKSYDPKVPGNDKKVEWKEGEMEKVARRLQIEINKIKSEYLAQGLVITMPN